MNMQYQDLGRVANAQEARTSAMTRASDGHFYLVICARGFLVSVDLQTGETRQFPFPSEACGDGYPFGSIGSRSGKVYLGGGKLFMEFDPAAQAYTFFQTVLPDELEYGAWCQEEAEDGTIYFGGVYKTHLTSFDPSTRQFRHYGILDPVQQYLGTLACDRYGYIYCSIGTAIGSIVVVHRESGERHVLPVPDDCRAPEICRARDGEVYVNFTGNSVTFTEYDPAKRWYRLANGALQEEMTSPFENEYAGHGFDRIHCPMQDHPTILHLDLVDHELVYQHPETGSEVRLMLEYETVGADLSPLTSGPDGKIYGTTNHPIQIYTYDPSSEELRNFGRKPFSREINGWGNICAYASHGEILGGAAYCGGYIVRIDTSQPISNDRANVNPHCEAEFPEILRPRSAVALPDGRTLAFGGYTIYGGTGGGLVFYDVQTRACSVVQNEDLLPGQSILSMVALTAECLLCGTSIEAPGGGLILADEASLFEFDVYRRTVEHVLVPIPGAREIAHLRQDHTGTVHGITSDGRYFAYDPGTRTVLAVQDLSAYGRPVRDGMAEDSEGTIYGLLNQAVYEIKPGTQKAEILSQPPCPITAGMALQNGRIYFGSGSHLWRCTL